MNSGNIELTPRTIWGIIIAILLSFFLYFYQHNPQILVGGLLSANANCTDDQSCNVATGPKGQVVGDCRDCIKVKGTKVPTTDGIGEYVDVKLFAKLKKLRVLNSNWRITEEYPPTVQHLNFCHGNGTCVDLGLYPEKRTAKNLDQLCTDALAAGLTLINEYSDKNLLSANSTCPDSNIFETTTGGHLHVQ
ncbi:MAG: hypothetical protein JWO40_580 [Candidatus Doudnabacteria bacterium]|nr:hypothetical protein [Candidatus Doudnabacteria bacterium]